MKKWIAIILALVLVVGGGTYWYMGKKAKAKASNVYIPTAMVQRGTLESDVSGSGSLSSDIDEDVTASISDTVYSVKVSVGQKVKKGQALLEYNNGTYLDAPDSGTITSLSVYNQTQVKPGQVVAHITNYTNLDTVVSVDELDIPKVKLGQPVEVTVNAYPTTKFTGKVTKIADTGTDTNGVSTFDVTVHLDNSKNLKPGMTTSANIITSKKANTLYVPIGAIHKQGNATYVLVDSGSTVNQRSTSAFNNSSQGGMTGRRKWRNMAGVSGKAQMVPVKTGINNDNDIEILSGLKEGQVVQLPPIVRNASASSSTGNGYGFGMYGGGGFGGNGFNRMNRMNRNNSGNNKTSNKSANTGGGGN
ncbi:MAG TPA: efflux RND transporter periplasmic adaptor subunit [Sporolactobacillaceae bacterium]|nr:efflux RND transporter periplasmic adaptor subunit [Sporolactobacillaceae bacterium]